jgi:ATP-dependent RNA helicase RhlB
MAIRLIKSLASRVRKGSGGGSKSDSAAPSPAKGPRGSAGKGRRGGKAPDRQPKSETGSRQSGDVETWRPGQASSQGPKPSRAPSADESPRPPRKRRHRKPRPRPNDDTGLLSQPGDDLKPQASPAAEPKAERQPQPERERQPRPPRKPRPSRQPRPEVPVPAEPAEPWSLDDYKVEPAEDKTRFHDVDLPDEIMHALSDLKFQYCTPIQARVLQEVAEGHNVAGRAQTGTGKTAAFLLLTFKQFLQNPLPADRPSARPRALVIAPTRELVIQIMHDAEALGKYCGIRSMAVFGGTDFDKQERELMRGPIDLVAATPGRLLDFQRRRIIDLRGVEVLVIDEADRMLDMGFIPDVRTIIRSTPPKERRRTLLFSATLTDDVMRLASQWMPDPHVVEIEPDQVAVDTVKQLVYMVRANEKFTVLYNLLKRPNIGRVLIFANRRDQTERIAGELQRYGIKCELLSGAVNQNRRMRVLEDFRSGKVMTVVATDVAGRGLHVDDIDHVVNFDLPYEAEDYVHRIGRTGRAGAEGTAVSFACEDESFTIPEIEEYIGEELSCLHPEDSLLRPLPHTDAKPYRRPERSGPGGRSGGHSGGRGGGGRYGGSRHSGPGRRR